MHIETEFLCAKQFFGCLMFAITQMFAITHTISAFPGVCRLVEREALVVRLSGGAVAIWG
jgi:hypothetical protein